MSAGLVVNVVELVAGSELVADVSAGASSITVEDPTDFNPEGGDLKIGAEEKSYSVVNEDTGVITLDSTLANAYTAEDRVTAMPEYVERFAFVQLEEQDETLQARVPHALYDRLVVGTRDVNLDEGELVELERDPGGELVVADIIDREPLVDAGFIDPGSTIPPDAMTDGLAPATSPAPTVFGGVLSLFVTWVAVSNPDPVTYEVHVSTSSGFTPSGGTLAGEARGTLFVIRHLPGTTNPPAYGTTYFVKLIARDADGAAAASAEDSATPEEGMQSAIIADLIAANAVIAEKLETVLALTSSLVAGTLGAQRVEIGYGTDGAALDTGFIGVRAFGPDGTTLTFSVDAETGEVYVKGRVDWGTASKLLTTDIMELGEQHFGGGFADPARVQSAGGTISAGSLKATWPTATKVGNLLLCAVAYRIASGTPTVTTPSGWTLVDDVTNGTFIVSLFKIENAASRSGAQTVAIGGSSVDGAIVLFEYDGAQVEDVKAEASGTSTSGSTGTTGTTTQADELAFSIIGRRVGSSSANPTSPTNGFTRTRTQNGGSFLVQLNAFEKILTATGTTGHGCTFPESQAWAGLVVTFKAKVAAAVGAGAADIVRIYAKDVGGAPAVHVTDDAGVANSAVLGPEDEVWRLMYLTGSLNIANLAAHTGATETLTVTGLALNDIVLSVKPVDVTDMRALILHPDPLGKANAVDVIVFNADTVARNPASSTFHVVALRRST